MCTGCQFVDRKIQLEYLPLGAKESNSLGDLYFSKLIDARADKGRIGALKHGVLGTDTANVQTDQDVTIWISKAISSELANIGYTVTIADANKIDIVNDNLTSIPVVSGVVNKVFAEPIIGIFNVDMTGNIQITLEVYLNGKVRKKTYTASEKVTTYGGTFAASSYKDSLEKTLQSLLIQIKNDFKNMR
ncbi:MAG: YajG family lipoprotein [bacterium]